MGGAMTECAWAAKNPTKNVGHGQHCYGWSCRQDVSKCHRKRDAANRRKAEQSSYRKFPGSPYQQARKAAWDKAFAEQKAVADGDHLTEAQWDIVRAAAPLPTGHCAWCGKGIRDARNPMLLNTRRSWHPGCVTELFLHTRVEAQAAFLRERDGPMCRCCGERRGSQVDHVLALGLVVLVILEPYRWGYWGPGNLALLCHECHVAKTREDVAAIKAMRKQLMRASAAAPLQMALAL